MVVPEKKFSPEPLTPQQRRRAKIIAIRIVISFFILSLCFVAIVNRLLPSPILGLEFLKLEWWQIGAGIVISVVLLMGGEDGDDELFKTDGDGPPIIR